MIARSLEQLGAPAAQPTAFDIALGDRLGLQPDRLWRFDGRALELGFLGPGQFIAEGFDAQLERFDVLGQPPQFIDVGMALGRDQPQVRLGQRRRGRERLGT